MHEIVIIQKYKENAKIYYKNNKEKLQGYTENHYRNVSKD